MQALILAPTRELALQVCQHLQKAVDAASVTPSVDGEEKTEEEAEVKKPSGIPRVSVGAIVGGMSAQKQKRVLERGVDILVATPGRLWDLIGEVRFNILRRIDPLWDCPDLCFDLRRSERGHRPLDPKRPVPGHRRGGSND